MGPVGILCVQRTLEKGRRTGFFTGIGAAISDMIYCLLTGFGLSFIEDFLTRNHNILQLIGSIVLIGFGIYLFRSNPSRSIKKPGESISDKKNILNGFLFTFSNPLIIFLIIGLFARFNFFVPEITFFHYVVGFAGIGAGALIWWWIVSFSVAKLRSHFNLRSMWLINKIIGAIIFIFAIVGIVTAISEMSKAATPILRKNESGSIYLNRTRGYGDFMQASDSVFLLSSNGKDTVCDLIRLPDTESFEMTFRSSNLNNSPGKRYKYSDGKHVKKTKHPEWGIIYSDLTGHRESVIFKTTDSPTDETYSPTFVRVRASDTGETAEITSGFDFFTGPNAFALRFDRGIFTLSAGNRDYRPIMSWESRITQPDSIGFLVSPGGKIKIEDIAIETRGLSTITERSQFGNPDILDSYLSRTTDPYEGRWKMFDRNLDESVLRQGGEYTVAIIRTDTGYDLHYLSGAEKNPQRWRPGRIKARLTDTGFHDTFDVLWIDASGKVIENAIKAQFDGEILSIQFPYQNSSIRLRKLP